MKAPPHITLTEAMTEICEGLPQKADVYIDARNAREQERAVRFLESARARANALIEVGLDPEAFQMSEPNPLSVGPFPPEVATHRALSLAHKLERDEEVKRLWQAGREIVVAGATTQLKIKGRPQGHGKLEEIDSAELSYLAFNEQTGLDILYNRDTEFFWAQVTLGRAEFYKWRLQGAAVDPSSGSEKRALDHLAKCLKADELLTKAAGKKALQDAQIRFTDAGFERRIWAAARLKAGLPAKGRSGPRPKSSKS